MKPHDALNCFPAAPCLLHPMFSSVSCYVPCGFCWTIGGLIDAVLLRRSVLSSICRQKEQCVPCIVMQKTFMFSQLHSFIKKLTMGVKFHQSPHTWSRLGEIYYLYSGSFSQVTTLQITNQLGDMDVLGSCTGKLNKSAETKFRNALVCVVS